MSSKPASPIRNPAWAWIGLAACCLAQPAWAQEAADESLAASAAPESGVIDILAAQPKGEVDLRRIEQCERERDASSISGEIVVCREIVVDSSDYYSADREAAQRRYARETQYADTLQTPDVTGPGIFRGPATVGKLCIPGLQKCPPPPALIFDITALPEAPPGSDADRIARGLPPIGNDSGIAASEQDLLGLPPPPVGGAEETPDAVSPAESAAPAVEP